MKKVKKRIRKKRSFTEGFRKKIVEEFESGKFSVKELGYLYKIHPQLIYRWIYKYSTVNKRGYRIVEAEKSTTMKIKELKKKLAEYERIIGQKQLEIDFLNKIIDKASERYNEDLKKNLSIRPSNGLSKTKKK